MATQIIHRIPSPYFDTHMIEVYGEPDNAKYEWRIVFPDGKRFYDTGAENKGMGRIYGIPEIALRDALMAETNVGQFHSDRHDAARVSQSAAQTTRHPYARRAHPDRANRCDQCLRLTSAIHILPKGIP